jgi:glycosyltransferase involved in cell wall biosynthesis
MAAASVLVVPSLRPEPFGNVLLEGLAAGCRVIAFEGGGPSDLAQVFPDAVEVTPRSTDALAAGLRRWHESGGGGLTSAEWDRTGDVLREQFGSRRAAHEWRGVLERPAG